MHEIEHLLGSDLFIAIQTGANLKKACNAPFKGLGFRVGSPHFKVTGSDLLIAFHIKTVKRES